MKRVLILFGCLFALSTPYASGKSWITKLENNSSFFVTYQSTDESAGNIINDKCRLNRDPYIVGPKSSVFLSDAVVPWKTYGLIKITVHGVDRSGNTFTAAQATILEDGGKIWIDTGTKLSQRPEFKFTIVVSKDGNNITLNADQ